MVGGKAAQIYKDVGKPYDMVSYVDELELPFTQVGHLLPEGCKVSQVSQNFTIFSLLGLCTSYVWSVAISFALDWPVSAEQATLLLTVDCSILSHW